MDMEKAIETLKVVGIFAEPAKVFLGADTPAELEGSIVVYYNDPANETFYYYLDPQANGWKAASGTAAVTERFVSDDELAEFAKAEQADYDEAVNANTNW